MAAAGRPAATGAAASISWTKNHPLEGDGLLVNFYNHMWKKNKDFQSCPGVRCPDTVVYDHNFPRGWYTYDQKNKELKKKQGKELDTSSIFSAFSKSCDANVDIVASYLYSYESEANESVTSVEFFTKEDLSDFLNNRKSKKEGILQKFLVPKGLNNSLIQAVWSPRVCIVQRKTNRHAIGDRSYSPYERAVTYEGPSHYTEDGICAPKTTQQIKEICQSICAHFTSTEHKNITRMVLYFKVDKNDQVWLLWCGSIRISDRQHQSQLPLNLSPIFTSPDQSTLTKQHVLKDSDVLHDVDNQQFKLSGDRVFQMTHCHASSPQSTSPKSPKQLGVGGKPGFKAAAMGVAAGEDEEATGRASGNESLGGRSPNHGSTHVGHEADTTVKSEWYKLDERIHEQYKQLKEEYELVSQILDDVFYEAYSHFLQHHSGAFFFSLPSQLRQIVGSETLDRLLSHLRIQPVPDHELAKQAKKGDVNMELGLDLWIPDMRHQPISKLGTECRMWVKALYDKREAELKRQCTISLGALGEDDVLNSYSISKLSHERGGSAGMDGRHGGAVGGGGGAGGARGVAVGGGRDASPTPTTNTTAAPSREDDDDDGDESGSETESDSSEASDD